MIGRLFKKCHNLLAQGAGRLYSVYNTPDETPMAFALRPHQQEAVAAMERAGKGLIVVPTGGGKTLMGITDAVRRLESSFSPITVVVVAPRILLANQLCEEYMEVISERVANVQVMHVHSGETTYTSSTKVKDIMVHTGMCMAGGMHQIIFTTYHSLTRVAEAGVEVDSIYFDEAHNSVQRHFYPATKYFAQTALRSFFFTATPKYSAVAHKPGMNDASVYGNVIMNVPAPAMVKGGFIVPPKVVTKTMETIDKADMTPQRDAQHVIDALDEHKAGKVLVAAKSVRQIIRMVGETDFAQQLRERGYSYMHISASHGAFIDGLKVDREHFFQVLNQWGGEKGKKFVVLHHSILSEGINVSGLEAVVFLRAMDAIAICQTIGRAIRLHKDDAKGLRNGSIKPGDLSSYTKSFGLCIVPVFNKTQASAAKSIQRVVEIVFTGGQPAVSTIRR